MLIMIPKTLHYFWFGKGPKSDVTKRVIESWKSTCPDFEIKEWTEENYDVDAHPFTKEMHAAKRWAFVADYARLDVLEREGGIYLDTDMLLIQSLTPFIKHECFLGEENPGVISAGALGAVAHHPYIKACKDYYDTVSIDSLQTIPRILTSIYQSRDTQENIVVYPPKTFYPFSMHEIQKYHGQPLSPETYGVHLWDYSWGHPLNKFFKKAGIHRMGTHIVEKLGIKQVLKKLLGFV